MYMGVQSADGQVTSRKQASKKGVHFLKCDVDVVLRREQLILIFRPGQRLGYLIFILLR